VVSKNQIIISIEKIEIFIEFLIIEKKIIIIYNNLFLFLGKMTNIYNTIINTI
jgi:hypothetical protein